jgi:hypothetical protein
MKRDDVPASTVSQGIRTSLRIKQEHLKQQMMHEGSFIRLFGNGITGQR